MADGTRTVKIKFDGSTKGLDGAAAKGVLDMELMQKAVNKFEGQTSAASQKIKVAHDNVANAAGKLRVAELELQDLQASGVAKASDLAKAEEKVATARRNLENSTAKLRSELDGLNNGWDRFRAKAKGAIGTIANGAQNFALMASKVAALSGGLNIVVSLVGALTMMSGVLGLVPAAAAAGVAAMLTLKLGADGIKAAFQGLSPQLDALKSQVSATFQKGLTPAVNNLKVLLPQLTGGFKGIASAMSGVLVQITAWAKTPAAVSQLNTLLSGTGQIVRNVGAAFAPLIAAFVRIGAVAMPILAQLTAGLGGAADKFNQFIQRAADSGQLAKWIQGGIAAFKQLFHIIGQIGDIVATVFSALKDAGVGLGGVLGPVLDQIQAFVHSAEGHDAIVALARAINQVGQAVGQVLGAALKAVGPMLPDIAKALGDIATIAAQTLVPAIQHLAPILQKIIDAFNNLPGPIKDVIVQAGLVALAFKKLGGSKLLNLVPGLNKAFGDAGKATEAGSKGVAGKFTAGFKGALSKAGWVGAGLAIANDLTQGMFEGITHGQEKGGIIDTALDGWKMLFDPKRFHDTGFGLTPEQQKALDDLQASLRAIPPVAAGAAAGLGGFFGAFNTPALNAFKGGVDAASGSLVGLSGTAVAQMGAFAGAVAAGSGSAAVTMGAQVGAMVSQTGALMQQMNGNAGLSMGGFAGAVAAGSGSAAAIMGGNVGAIVGNTNGGLSQLPGIAGAQMGAMSGAISNVGGSAIGAARGVAGGVAGALNGVNLYGAGVSIMEGLAAGMKAQAAAAYAAARSIAAGVAAAAKGALGIHSPSKVMAEEVGRWIPAGIGQGVWKYRASALDAVTSLTSQMRAAAGATGLGTVSSQIGAAASELARQIQAGGTIFEDFTYRGNSDVVRNNNDAIAALFSAKYGNTDYFGDNATGDPADVLNFLQGLAASSAAPAAGGGQTVNVTLDLGAGIQQRMAIEIDRNNRATVRSLTAGAGANR